MQENTSSLDVFVYLSPSQLEALLKRLQDSGFVVGSQGHIFGAKPGVKYPVNEHSTFRPQLPVGFIAFQTDGGYFTAQMANLSIDFPGNPHSELREGYYDAARGRQFF